MRLLGGFWGGFGPQVEAKLGTKSIKNRSRKKHATKMVLGNYYMLKLWAKVGHGNYQTLIF